MKRAKKGQLITLITEVRVFRHNTYNTEKRTYIVKVHHIGKKGQVYYENYSFEGVAFTENSSNHVFYVGYLEEYRASTKKEKVVYEECRKRFLQDSHKHNEIMSSEIQTNIDSDIDEWENFAWDFSYTQ